MSNLPIYFYFHYLPPKNDIYIENIRSLSLYSSVYEASWREVYMGEALSWIIQYLSRIIILHAHPPGVY